MLSAEQRVQLHDLIDDALALPIGQREAFVEDSDIGDPAVLELAKSALSDLTNPTASASITDTLAGTPPELEGRDLTGSLLGHRYRVLERIRSGGNGTVYRARDENLGTTVALKAYHGPGGAWRAEVYGMALGSQEARDALVDTLSTGDQHLVVMRWIDGSDLRDLLVSLEERDIGRTQSPEIGLAAFFAARGLNNAPTGSYWTFVADCIRLAAESLQRLHDSGFVHQDVSPKNIMFVARGDVRLIDFDLARPIEGQDAGRRGGTLGFMAPEYLRGDPDVSLIANDVHALGATLVRLLLGEPSPSAKSMEGRVPNFRNLDRRDLRVPADLWWIARKACDPSPSERYPSPSAMAEDIGRFQSHRPVLAHRPNIAARLKLAWRRNPSRIIAALLLPLLAMAAFYVIRNERHKAHEAAARQLAQDTSDAVRRLPALWGLLADPSIPRRASYTEPAAVRAAVDELVALHPAHPALRLRRTIMAARTATSQPGDLAVVRKDLAILSVGAPETGTVAALREILLADDPDTRHDLTAIELDTARDSTNHADVVTAATVAFLCRDHALALTLCDRALALVPNDWVTHELAGAAAALTDKPERSAYEFGPVRRLLSGTHTNTDLHFEAYLLSQSDPYGGAWGDLDAATALWTECLQRVPEQYLPLHNLAWNEMARGQYADAIDLAQRAAMLRGDTPRLYDLRAKCLRALGRNREARDLLREGIERFASDGFESPTKHREMLVLFALSSIESLWRQEPSKADASRTAARRAFAAVLEHTTREPDPFVTIEARAALATIDGLSRERAPNEVFQALAGFQADYLELVAKGGYPAPSPHIAEYQLMLAAHCSGDIQPPGTTIRQIRQFASANLDVDQRLRRHYDR